MCVSVSVYVGTEPWASGTLSKHLTTELYMCQSLGSPFIFLKNLNGLITVFLIFK